MLRKIVFLLLLIPLFLLFVGAEATVTVTTKDYGGMDTYHFTFSADSGDTAIVVPSGADYFNIDAMNKFGPTITFDTDEATADSVRFSTIVQVKNQVTGSWISIVTYADTNSTSRFTHVFDQTTYGYWPLMRIVMASIGATAAKSDQAVTGELNFKKDLDEEQ